MQAAPPIASYPPRACLNCAAQLHGPFCAQCGQQDVSGPMRVRDYVADGLAAHFDWLDGKLPRSLWSLVSRPGFLTREFIAGRRVPYLLPWRLYLLVSVVFFFLVDHFDPVTVQSFGASGVDPRLAERMNGSMAGLLPVLLLVVVPAFTLGVWLLHVRGRPLFAEHLAFAFHFFSFVFLAFVPPVLTGMDALWQAAFAAIFVYLVLALRAVYAQSLPRTLAKGVALFAWFNALLMLYFVFVLVIAGLRVLLS